MVDVMADDDDPVVEEIDVFLSKELADKLYLIQYPVRPAHMTYDEVSHLGARMKPKQEKLELELAVNTFSPNYAQSKGEQIALNVDGDQQDQDVFYHSNRMDKQGLTSRPVGVSTGRYVMGMLQNRELHMTPLQGIIQMRPSFSYLDKADTRHKAAEADVGDASQDEEEEAKPVMMKFARQETAEAKARRMASYEYLRRKHDKESWVNLQHYPIRSTMADRERSLLFARQLTEVSQFHVSAEDYLKRLVPDMELQEAEKPAMPTNVLSMAELKSMNLNDQIQALLTNAKVIRFNQLLAHLPKGTDPTSALRCVQQVALLVQGAWVVKSEVLYPKDSFSAFTGVPAETICRGRDYIMWRFNQNRYLVRKDISSVIKLPAEDVKDMLEQMAKLRVNKGWEFLTDFDSEFVSRHPEVVQRQQMIWDAKFQQLSKVLKISQADLKAADKAAAATAAAASSPVKRRRTISRSRTKSGSERSMSDLSDTDNEASRAERGRRLSGSDRSRKLSGGDHIHKLQSIPPFVANHVGTGNDVVMMGDTDGVSANNDKIDINLAKKNELLSFVREKMSSRFVFTMHELKIHFNLRLAQCPPGHVLGLGVSDKLLEQAVYDCDCVKMPYPNSDDEPIFVATRVGDRLDTLRKVTVDMLASGRRIKTSSLKKKLEEEMDSMPPDSDIKKVLKDYCVTRGGSYQLKGIQPS